MVGTHMLCIWWEDTGLHGLPNWHVLVFNLHSLVQGGIIILKINDFSSSFVLNLNVKVD